MDTNDVLVRILEELKTMSVEIKRLRADVLSTKEKVEKLEDLEDSLTKSTDAILLEIRRMA